MNEIKSADLLDGNYKNPILSTDYSDPDVIRCGEDFYMTASSFTDTPGLPILHSKDLVNWKVINYCLDNLPDESYFTPRFGCGVWAPAIRFHDGMFYVCFPMPDEGIYMTRAKDPREKWSEPVCILKKKGFIDPCPFWDEDGKAYLVYASAKSRRFINNELYISEMAPDGLSLKNEKVTVYKGEDFGHITTEGPKLYKRNGYYYIFAPAGGVKSGYQLAMRSENIYGPYEVRKVLEEKDTGVNGPHQGAWVDTLRGEDWFIHFQDVYAGGRIIHLEPMKWVQDWPVIGDEGKPVSVCKKPLSLKDTYPHYPDNTDYFIDGKINKAWQWSMNHEKDYIFPLEDSPGIGVRCLNDNFIDFHAMGQKNVLLQKWPSLEFKVDFFLDISNTEEDEFSGVMLYGIKAVSLAFTKIKGQFMFTLLNEDLSFDKEKVKIFSIPTGYKEFKGNPKDFKVTLKIRKNGYLEGYKLPKDLSPVVYEKFIKSMPEILPNAPRFLCEIYIDDEKISEAEPKAGRWTGSKVGVFAFKRYKHPHEGFLVLRKAVFEKITDND